MASTTVKFNEKTTGVVRGRFLDEDKQGIPGTDLDVLMMTLYLQGKPQFFARSSDDMLADPNFTVDSSADPDEVGRFVWTVRVFETETLNKATKLGGTENHTVYLEFGWNSAFDGELNSPFTTTADSKTVRVHHAGHGLLKNDSVYFNNQPKIGGNLDVGGIYVVRNVVDVDHYEIEHQTAAQSAEANVGGVTPFYANGKSGSLQATMVITKNDPI